MLQRTTVQNTESREDFLRYLWSFPKDNLFFARDKVNMLVNDANFWESVKQNKQGLNRSDTWTKNKLGLNLEILG